MQDHPGHAYTKIDAYRLLATNLIFLKFVSDATI